VTTERGSGVTIRAVQRQDQDGWVELRRALWPDDPDDHEREVTAFLTMPPVREACFVAVDGSGVLVGFAEIRLREHAESCVTSPVGYLEGIYVDPASRHRGVGRALVTAGEAWARARGCSEMASDRELANRPSGAFHESIGYEETARLVTYRKPLTRGGAP